MTTGLKLALGAGALIVLLWLAAVAVLAWTAAWPPAWPGHDREVEAMSRAAAGALPAVIVIPIALVGAMLLVRAATSRA